LNTSPARNVLDFVVLSDIFPGLQQIICMCILAEGPKSIKIFGRTSYRLPSGANKISGVYKVSSPS
jgi:hypothetical protein